MQGRPFAAVLERAQKAAFDERISLVSLLLAGLNTRFAAARRADAVTDACYQEMRSFKRTLNNADPRPRMVLCPPPCLPRRSMSMRTT